MFSRWSGHPEANRRRSNLYCFSYTATLSYFLPFESVP